MSKNGKNGKGVLADPTRLQPLDPDEKELITVVVETPKGCRNKYAFDPKERVFRLKKVLPAGMTFPYDFGFVPRTEALAAFWLLVGDGRFAGRALAGIHHHPARLPSMA